MVNDNIRQIRIVNHLRQCIKTIVKRNKITPTPCIALPIKGEMPEGQRGSNNNSANPDTPHGSPHKGGDAQRAERVQSHPAQLVVN